MPVVHQETDKGNGDHMRFVASSTIRSMVMTGLVLGGLFAGLSHAEAAADGEKALWVGGAGGAGGRVGGGGIGKGGWVSVGDWGAAVVDAAVIERVDGVAGVSWGDVAGGGERE